MYHPAHSYFPAPPAPPARRTALAVVAAVAAGVVILLAAGGVVAYLALRSTSITAAGELALRETDDQSCTGVYHGDIRAGVQLTVTDPAGAIVGVAELGTATATTDSGQTMCRFPFRVTVPASKTSYGITVLRHGTLQFTERGMRAGPTLALN